MKRGPSNQEGGAGENAARAGWPELVAILLIAGGGAGAVFAGSSLGAIAAFAGLALALRRYLDGVRRDPIQTVEGEDPYWW